MSEYNELITQSDKQKAMAAAWKDKKALKKDTIANARTVYKETKQQAKANKTAALEERKKALHEAPQDPAKVQAATKKVEQANQAIAQAKTVKNAAIKEAKANYNTRHDELRAAEKAHNKDSWDKPFNQDMTLKEMRAEEDSILHDTDNAGTDNAGTDNANDPSSSESGSESTNKSDSTDNVGTNNTQGGIMKGKNQGLRFSDSFYRDVGAMVRGQRTGNLADSEAETSKEQAQNQRNEAATHQMEAQRAQQIANQNAYAEAGKMASVQNDAENRQNVQKAGVLGAGAALARKTNTPDVQSQMAREDQQQNIANQRREEADAAQQGATESEGDVRNLQIESRDLDTDRNEASDLSLGKDITAQAVPETQAAEEQVTEEQTTEEQTTEEQANDQPEQTEPEETPMPSGNPQHVINWLLGSSKGQDIQPQAGADGDNGLAAWVQEKYGVQPAPKWKYDSADPTAKKWEQMWLNDGEISGDKQAAIQALRQGRAGEGNDASKNFDAGNYDQMNKNMTVESNPPSNPPSDARIKNIRSCLSDLRMKYIKEDFDRDGKCSKNDLLWLMDRAGNFSHNGQEYDVYSDDTVLPDDDSILRAYGEHIRNYVYNYKPEAVDVDPRIDPNEEHIGPMAQDIEQVNPACIKETAEGVKTVDTARLAMMNAGAIGDLARQLDELNKKFQALGL